MINYSIINWSIVLPVKKKKKKKTAKVALRVCS